MIHCNFCYRHCKFSKTSPIGYCKQRILKNNEIISPAYGKLSVTAIDPIEKKPLYHFLPGSDTLSIAQNGCNFSCSFCQNWTLSQQNSLLTRTVTPDDVVKLCISKKLPSISFTYTEPIIWQNFLLDCAKKAKTKGLATIMITNGSFSKEALTKIIPFIDAFNIDLKGDANFYKKICNANITPVKKSIEYISKSGKHIEITSLLIEGIHSLKWIQETGNFLNNTNIKVWHLSRFFPNYKMSDRQNTSELFLQKAIRTAYTTGIPFIYGGNSINNYETKCPFCGNTLIYSRKNKSSIKKDITQNIDNNTCKFCGKKIYGNFQI